MSFRSHLPFETVVPDLSTPSFVFSVPLKRGSSVKFSECRPKILDPIGAQKNMIMIWQKTPGIYLLGMLFASAQHT